MGAAEKVLNLVEARDSTGGPIDKDGFDGNVEPNQIIIDFADNGYIVTSANESTSRVYLANSKDEHGGPKALIRDLIVSLGLAGKVKVED